MDLRRMRLFVSGGLVVLAAMSPAWAGSITTHVTAEGLMWSTRIPNSGADLTVAGPNDFYQTEHATNLGDLHYTLFPEDGLYKYELTLIPVVRQTRGAADVAVPERTADPGHKTSGTVRIVNGLPLDPNAVE